MNTDTLILLIAVVVYTLVVSFYVERYIKRTKEKYDYIIEDLKMGLGNLIVTTEKIIETRLIHDRVLKDGTRKFYYNNEYSTTYDNPEMDDQAVQDTKTGIALEMIEDILNGKENVI